MKESEYFELCAYIGAIWGRELTPAQKTAGWKLLSEFSAQHVGAAVTQLADDGADRLPVWPVVLKATRSVFEHDRDRIPALPAGDSLTDEQHRGAMIMLRAKMTEEQCRRADRMTGETKQLAMGLRLQLTKLLMKPWSQLEPKPWDKTFDRTLAEFTQVAAAP